MTFAVAVTLAVLHVVAGALKFLDRVPRSRWLSAAGGVSVAYVFVHLLPELGSAQESLRDHTDGVLGYLDAHVYVAALVGLTVFYGLERAAVAHDRTDDASGPRLFGAYVASYAAYNAVIGYLLVERSRGVAETAMFAVAMGVHFVVNDHGLHDRFRRPYERWGRWLLAGAILAGWVVGSAVEVGEALLHLAAAFLAGGVILNVMKEELPSERGSRFGAFAAGALLYTLLLLVVA